MNLRNASIEGREVTLWVISCSDAVKWRCLLYPRKRTFHSH
jgi:hypothetical protein